MVSWPYQKIENQDQQGTCDLINNCDSAPLDLEATRLAVRRRLIISTWNMYSGWSAESERGLVEAAKRLGNLIHHCRAEEQSEWEGFCSPGVEMRHGAGRAGKKTLPSV